MSPSTSDRKGIGGRPSKFTPETRGKIITAIRAGNYALVAARLAGIDDATFYRWLERGKDRIVNDAMVAAEPEFREFCDALAQAEAEVEVRIVASVMARAANGDRDGLRFLERRFPQRWRQQLTTELVGANGGPITTRKEPANDDLDVRLAAVLEALERAGKVAPPEGAGDAFGVVDAAHDVIRSA